MSVPARFLGYAAAGWAFEAVVRDRPSYSLWWGGAKVPLLPVYGVGGLVADQLAPRLAGLPVWQRALVYGVVLSGVELGACALSDVVFGRRQWDYNGRCVDLKHAAWWAALGLVLEAVRRVR